MNNEYCEISKEAFYAILEGRDERLSFYGSFENKGAKFEDFVNNGVLVRRVSQHNYCNYYVRDINY